CERSLALGEIGGLLRQIELAGAVERLALRPLLGDARLARRERLLPLGQARQALLGRPLELRLGGGQLGLPSVQALLFGPEPLEGRAETLFHLCRERVQIGGALHRLDLLRRLRRFFQFFLGAPGAPTQAQDEEQQAEEQEDEHAREQQEVLVTLKRRSRHTSIIAVPVATIALP